MTPFELSLESDLRIEWQRFANEWLFKWHGMTYEGGRTDVEDFKGGRISYAGIRFGHQQQVIFWAAVSNYLDKNIHEIFKRWDEETKIYPARMRRLSIEGVERKLRLFVESIIAHSADTDHRLRGAGHPLSVELFDASGRQAQAIETINQLGRAHLLLLDEVEKVELPKLSRKQHIENFLSEHKGIMAAIGLILGLAGLVKYFMK